MLFLIVHPWDRMWPGSSCEYDGQDEGIMTRWGRSSPPRSESSRSSARTISPSRSITCLENAGGVRPGFCHTHRFSLASCVFPFDKTAVGIYTVVPRMAGRAVGAGWKRCVVRPWVSDPIRESSVDARDRLKSSCCEDHGSDQPGHTRGIFDRFSTCRSCVGGAIRLQLAP